MLEELLQILKPGKPLETPAKGFSEMTTLTREMVETAGKIYFGESAGEEQRKNLYEKDHRVNELEVSIRKQVVAHLSMHGNIPDVPYGLLMMNLVRDLERIGDYAKNLSEAAELFSGALPRDEIVDELRRIRGGVEAVFRKCGDVLEESKKEGALPLIEQGKECFSAAGKLALGVVAKNYDSGTTAALVLGAGYYRRFAGHLLNVLSGVVMPVHKLDYYDEDAEPA